jgi:hypothetical protein
MKNMISMQSVMTIWFLGFLKSISSAIANVPSKLDNPRRFEACTDLVSYDDFYGLSVRHQSQTQALTDIFESMGGLDWTRRSGWGVGDPCVSFWYGIECDCYGNIIAIELSDNRVRGSLPPSIGQLVSLQVLDMHSSVPLDDNANSITGFIPSLANLTALEVIDFSGNNVIGMPDDMTHNGNLQVISLSRNQLASLPPTLGNLGALRVFEVDSNEGLAATFPADALCNMTDIVIVNMGNNSITGPFYNTCLKDLNPLIFDFTAKLTVSESDAEGLEGDAPAELVSAWSRIDKGYISFYLQPELTDHFGTVCADLRFCLWQNFRSHGDLSSVSSDSEVPSEVVSTINLAI